MAEAEFRQWDSYPQIGMAIELPALMPEVSFAWVEAAPEVTDETCCYQNAATCPDCGSGMVRLGTCFSCPSCGWGACG